MRNFRVRMIRIKGDRLSEAYAAYCLPSWSDFDVELVDAITPQTLYDDETYNSYSWSDDTFIRSPEEYASFTTKIKCWEDCANDTVPHLIIEHDAYLDYPDMVYLEDHINMKMLACHGTVAIFYTPDFCKRFISYLKSNKIEYGPMTTLYNKFLGYDETFGEWFFERDGFKTTDRIPVVVPVLDMKEKTTIPAHFDVYRGKNHRMINLFG